MGQYYRPVSLEKKESVYSHDYDNGLKLMEHSWIGNGFMEVVENLIAKGGEWFGTRIVWAGDYADNEVVDDIETDDNLYRLFRGNTIIPEIKKRKGKKLRYLVNITTKEFVDLNKVPVTNEWVNPKNPKDKWNFRIHPLSLLTCEGNGEGGGDFFGRDPNGLVGKWARNIVVMSRTKPTSKKMKELIFDLIY